MLRSLFCDRTEISEHLKIANQGVKKTPLRHYRLIYKNSEKLGTYAGKDVLQAANKAFTILSKLINCDEYIDFSMREVTIGSRSMLFDFVGKRVKLEINNDPNITEIDPQYVNNVIFLL